MTPAWYDDVVETGWSDALPRQLAGLPPIGGVLRATAEDFEVEELPAFEHEGAGPHLYVRVEKKNLTTTHLVGRLADAFGLRRKNIGYAGLKDRYAVTTQWLSVPLERTRHIETERALERLEAGREGDSEAGVTVRVIEQARHRHKLRAGHLSGNRFVVVVREIDVEAVNQIDFDAAVERLRSRGFPSYFGPQRFGRDRDNVARGLDIMRGEGGARGRLRRLLVSSVQSAHFNAVLATRLECDTMARPLLGDILMKTDSGGAFVSTEPDVDGPRLGRGEVEIAGPLIGQRTLQARGEPAMLERCLANAIGLDDARLRHPDEPADVEPPSWVGWPIESAATCVSVDSVGKLARGARRAMMVRPSELDVFVEDVSEETHSSGPSSAAGEPAAVTFRFTLPTGCYATSFLREFMGSLSP